MEKETQKINLYWHLQSLRGKKLSRLTQLNPFNPIHWWVKVLLKSRITDLDDILNEGWLCMYLTQSWLLKEIDQDLRHRLEQQPRYKVLRLDVYY